MLHSFVPCHAELDSVSLRPRIKMLCHSVLDTESLLRRIRTAGIDSDFHQNDRERFGLLTLPPLALCPAELDSVSLLFPVIPYLKRNLYADLRTAGRDSDFHQNVKERFGRLTLHSFVPYPAELDSVSHSPRIRLAEREAVKRTDKRQTPHYSC